MAASVTPIDRHQPLPRGSRKNFKKSLTNWHQVCQAAVPTPIMPPKAKPKKSASSGTSKSSGRSSSSRAKSNSSSGSSNAGRKRTRAQDDHQATGSSGKRRRSSSNKDDVPASDTSNDHGREEQRDHDDDSAGLAHTPAGSSPQVSTESFRLKPRQWILLIAAPPEGSLCLETQSS